MSIQRGYNIIVETHDRLHNGAQTLILTPHAEDVNLFCEILEHFKVGAWGHNFHDPEDVAELIRNLVANQKVLTADTLSWLKDVDGSNVFDVMMEFCGYNHNVDDTPDGMEYFRCVETYYVYRIEEISDDISLQFKSTTITYPAAVEYDESEEDLELEPFDPIEMEVDIETKPKDVL